MFLKESAVRQKIISKRNMIRSAGTVLLAAAVLIFPVSCAGPSAGPVSQDGYYLDTICSVSVYRMKDEGGSVKAASEMEDEANAAVNEAFGVCKELEGLLSRTRQGSDIYRINEAEGEWTEVSEATAEVIRKGIEYSELSGGDFDITVGGLTEQWDFHAAEGEAKIPDEKALAGAAAHVDYRNVEIDGGRVRLKDPDSKLDLGGIAKGYIGDRMTEALEQQGVVSATINLGGNVICIGSKTDDEDFTVGVETPFSDRTEIIGKIKAKDSTLVTSGVYERKIEAGGRTYHHILDASTGWPVKTDLDAVTLIADKGRSADIDALSTACLIKGSEKGMEFIKGMDGIEAVFVLSDGSVITTAGAGFEKE